MSKYEYEIIIKAEGEASEGYENSFPAGTPSTSDKGGIDTGAKGIFKTMSKAWSGAAMVRQIFGWQLSLVGRDTGNTDLQQKIDAAMSIGGQAMGVAFAFGVGGPAAGAMAMAAVGLSYLQQIEQYNYNRRWEGYELAETRRRAGPSFNRSRKEL